MPKLRALKQFYEAPRPRKVSRRSQNRQLVYDELVMELPEGQVGELEPDAGETTRALKVNLGAAGKRLGIALQVWDDKGLVYFRRGNKNGRMPSAAEIARATPALDIVFQEDEDDTAADA